MKHRTVILVAIFVTVLFSASAQLKKGTFRLGGTVGLGSSTTSYSYPAGGSASGDTKTSSFSFNPNVSYFFAKNFSLGLALPFSSSKSSTSGAETKTNSFSAGPMIRYYFPFDKVAIFPEVNYTLGSQSTSAPVFSTGNGTITDQKITTKLNMFRGGVGVTYFLNNSIGLEGIFYYQRSQVNYDNGFQPNTTTSSFGLNFGFQIYFSR